MGTNFSIPTLTSQQRNLLGVIRNVTLECICDVTKPYVIEEKITAITNLYNLNSFRVKSTLS